MPAVTAGSRPPPALRAAARSELPGTADVVVIGAGLVGAAAAAALAASGRRVCVVDRSGPVTALIGARPAVTVPPDAAPFSPARLGPDVSADFGVPR